MAHYDSGNMVDDHVFYTLRALVDEKIDIIFLSNSPVSDEDRKRLTPLVREIHVYPNQGYDWGAWKRYIDQNGIEKFLDYDELLLMNTTCFGPIFPLSEFFSEVANHDCDFYGISESYYIKQELPHIQSYFIGIKNNLFTNPIFVEFFQRIKLPENYSAAVRKCEIEFSQFLYSHNFKSWAYVQIDKNNPDKTANMFWNAFWLLNTKRVPFLKIKAFANDGYSYVNRFFNSGPDIIATVSRFSSYPVQLIRDHIRRSRPMSWHRDLDDNLIVTNSDTPHAEKLKIGVFAHLFYEDELYRLNKLNSIPQSFDLFVTTSVPDLPKKIEELCQQLQLNVDQLVIKYCPNRGRDFYGWLQIFGKEQQNYDICLKYKDKKSSFEALDHGYIWKNFIDESLLASKGHVSHLFNVMGANKKIGLIFPTYPPHLVFGGFIERYGDNIKNVEDIMNRLELPYHQENFPPVFPLGSELWYRPQALEPLFNTNWEEKDFPEEPVAYDGTILHGIERAIPYIANARGYEFRQAITPELLRTSFIKHEDNQLRVPKTLRWMLYRSFRYRMPEVAEKSLPFLRNFYSIYKKTRRLCSKMASSGKWSHK